MDKSDVIKLVKETPIRDEYKVLTVEKTEREVFCQVHSISQKEFFKAGEQGLKPQFRFTIANYADYQGEKIVVYHGVEHAVYRTYIRGTEEIELYAEEKVGLDV